MRYQFWVSDLAQYPTLTELKAAEVRLAAALTRPRVVAVMCVVGLSAFGWGALALMASDGTALWQALCRPNAAGGWSAAALGAAMWAAMVLAMMLPTAGPMILTYAEIADTAARRGEPVVSPFVLASGYLVVWLGFSVAAAVTQHTLARAGLFDGTVSVPVAGAMVIGAGLYQFTALKQACLSRCQRPFPFFFSNWTTEPRGVLRLGLRQGLDCVGCCWALMLLMFAVGAMNVAWMAALGVLMTIEKMTTTARFSVALGIALVALGFTMMALSVVQVAAWT